MRGVKFDILVQATPAAYSGVAVAALKRVEGK